ncbi:MAG: hypothetical protein D6B25_07895 [Desulfobulbaceae bacterium]|nr:MAG: hypothetical protein D6B25_07895 [Desulfobulbaceae bacterium]
MHFSTKVIDGITCVEFEKCPSLEDAKASLGHLKELDIYKNRLFILHTGFILSNIETQELAAFSRNLFREPCRAAVVAPNDLAFGTCRMLQAYRSDSITSFQVFRDYQSAADWMGTPLL